MSETRIDHRAKETAWLQRGPGTNQGPVPVVSVAPVTIRTPRWIWAWILPVVIIGMLIMARSVLGPFVIAAIFAYLFSPIIDNLQERLHWPRGLVVGLFYVVVLGAIGLGIYFGAEALVKQTQALAKEGPNILQNALVQFMGTNPSSSAGKSFTPAEIAKRVNDGLATYFQSGEALHIISEIVVRLLDTLLVIVVSLYLLLDGKRLGAYLLKFVPAESRSQTGYVAGRIHAVLGIYLRGQLLLIGIMSVVSYLVLQFIFNVPYAIPLAIMTGVLEILPLIGPAVAAGVVALVALSAHGVGAAIGIIIVYTILRQLEDQLVMPFVVGKAVHLHPVVTIFAVLAGGAMVGILGMLLAIPAAAAINIILDYLYPTNPDVALAHAMPGMKKAEMETDADHGVRHHLPQPRQRFAETRSVGGVLHRSRGSGLFQVQVSYRCAINPIRLSSK